MSLGTLRRDGREVIGTESAQQNLRKAIRKDLRKGFRKETPVYYKGGNSHADHLHGSHRLFRTVELLRNCYSMCSPIALKTNATGTRKDSVTT